MVWEMSLKELHQSDDETTNRQFITHDLVGPQTTHSVTISC